jgi:2-polyprenyl-3-methyl-5-hydroxy-6-metoxy-1,4-benzoquinol methylase
VPACWICGGRRLSRYYESRMDFREYADQDPEISAYTGERVWFVRCAACGFGQPEQLPTLRRFFERMYDQRWSHEWVEQEFAASYKDAIFASILRRLDALVPQDRRTLLDIGAHAGRFMWMAQRAGWTVEGVELNPRTAAFAAKMTGAPVHRTGAETLALEGRCYGAVVLTDVLEHIPAPAALVHSVVRLLEPRGVLAIKVPNGRAQFVKERWLARLTSHQISLAENLVHVNQFGPDSLRRTMAGAGLAEVSVSTAPPERVGPEASLVRRTASRLLRGAVFAAASLPGAVRLPIALHLQAYGRKPA